jgi:hypothetical protein
LGCRNTALGTGIWVDADTVPALEQHMCGVALEEGFRFGKGRGEKATPAFVVTFGQLLSHGEFADLIVQ